jgi:hypothetical protein
MHEVSDTKLNARLSLDDRDRVRQITHLEAPWQSDEKSPVTAAIEYLRQMAGVLGMQPAELENAHQELSFSDPMERGVEYRVSKQKQLFDSSTLIFNQTYLNVPVWRAAVTLTLKHNPIRVLTVTDTSEEGMDAPLPPRERIEEHRRLFALAAADERLRVLGLDDKASSAGLAEDDEQPKTAAYIRQVLDRGAAEDAAWDDARAIRGRFFVYRYDEKNRLPDQPSGGAGATAAIPESPAPENPEEPASSGPAVPPRELPILDLPPVDASIDDGAWRLASEFTFSLTTAEFGAVNWRALVDVETDSVLLLEPLISGLTGMVFVRDPITSTGDGSKLPSATNAVLNPLRTSVTLPNLDAPIAGVQALRGKFAVVADVNPPNIAPPTNPANAAFNYDVRTNNYAAVSAYYHTDRFFALVESLGFHIASYFNNTTFPLRVDHRDNVGGSADTINAWCVGNGAGGIGYAGYALNDLGDTANPIGRACDSRVHLHELGGHGVLYEHVGRANFGFAHSAGDSLSAILHDPDTRAPDRFRYSPWNPQNTRRFDRRVGEGWAWGGSLDERGYQSEQILCTTLFRIYRAIGGDSTNPGEKRFASRMMMYLILRAISTLTPATNPNNAVGFANALMVVDLLNWTSEGVFGGAYNKVIRWSFEKQGLYQAPGAPVPVAREGEPPDVDVYIDDGRRGEYQYKTDYMNNASIWNRRAADGGSTHQQPAVGAINHAYVRIRNRGTKTARNVRVRGFHKKSGGGTSWPASFEPLATAELSAGTLAARNAQARVVGPFRWIPNADASGQDSLLMAVSADGDRSNLDHFTAGETIPQGRLVPNDNNLGLRKVTLASSESEEPATTPAEGRAKVASDAVDTAEQLLQTLGFSAQRPKKVGIKSLTLQIDLEDE